MQQLRSRKLETPDFTLSRIVRRADSYLSLRERWRWPDKLFPLEAPPARFHRAASKQQPGAKGSLAQMRLPPALCTCSGCYFPADPAECGDHSLKKIQTPTRGIESQNSETTVRRGDYAASPTLRCALCTLRCTVPTSARAGRLLCRLLCRLLWQPATAPARPSLRRIPLQLIWLHLAEQNARFKLCQCDL